MFNPDSPAQLAKLFFGGEIEVKERKLVGKYKNGNDKYQTISKKVKVKGLGLKPVKKTPGGSPSTDDSVLSIIAKREDTEAGKIAKLLLKTRELNKQIGTYYEAASELVYPHDSCVHAEFSHCGYEKSDSVTGGGIPTGRLSCRNPNLQNQPGKPSLVKEHYTSRYGEEGVLIEFDYCLAPETKVLTGDFKWEPIENIKEGDFLVGFDEHKRSHDGRKFKMGKVEKTKRLIKNCIEIVTEEGKIIASTDHMFLSKHNSSPQKWTKAEDLKIGDYFTKVSEVWETHNDFESGWMSGFLDGEGYICPQGGFGYGQNNDGDNLLCFDKANELCSRLLPKTKLKICDKRRCKLMRPAGLRTGWQAVGVFQPVRLKAKLQKAIEKQSVRSKRNRRIKILEINFIGEREVIAVQTYCKTFLAEGFLSHNCQVEVFVFAYLTQDTQLLKDLREGVDIHRVMYANCYNVPLESVTDSQRKGIKACTFHVIYGGGAGSMAKRMGLDEEFCKEFIKKFYQRYPMAKVWQDNLVRQVDSISYPNGKNTILGQPQREGSLRSITGRKYIFTTMDSPKFLQEKGIMTSFNPPDIKNYPVQGLATGDIVPMMIGRTFRNALHYRDQFLLVNTIHDSLIIDSRKEFVQNTCKIVKHSLELVQEAMKSSFGLDFNLKVEVDCKVGSNWLEMNVYEVI